MADRLLPFIRAEDYTLFRALVPDLPKGYINWFDRYRRETRTLIRRGERPIEVMVDPDAFDEFCHAHKRARNLKTLEDFVIEQAAGQMVARRTSRIAARHGFF